ncbi:hypothetical protein EG68_01052 [Paragonimus skrjabini miyazakii]|uniref:ZP domain-containing protein n=1 Tax=Paragonimus skrjabini miyazakii TaxID=59628 RepID=A0A8S9Z893_9TREM|nr:hypothetical protein EG68_01052 [Paragonimus skrjabini miyazakii]
MHIFCFLFCPTLIRSICANEHLVYAGACASYDDEFCSRQVENSICNKLKNECFCRKDFVAIRENGRVTCKTLLTDLKCRVDRDCVHVNRSSCHPGAGYCSCPGSTTYVPQLHACRNRIEYTRDTVCETCHQAGGVCFLYEKYELFADELRYNQNRIGCVCSGMGRFTRIKTQNWTSDICSGELVDIGFPCDEKTSFCRSKNAVCRSLNPTHFTQSSQSTIWPKHTEEIGEQVHHSRDISVCQCKENTVSVYQKTLDYFECFPKLAHVAAECDACTQRNGECYDHNGDGVGDGCKCPSDRSTMTSRKESAENVCAQMHAFINCDNVSLSVCYLPHSVEPHNTLSTDISDGLAAVRLVPSLYSGLFANSTMNILNVVVWSTKTSLRSVAKDNVQSSPGGLNEEFLHMQLMLNLYPKSLPANVKSSDPCELRDVHLVPSVSRDLLNNWFGQTTVLERHPANISPYCLYSDVWSLQRLCGLRIHNIGKTAVQYEALLEVSVNRSVHTPNRDIRIPLKCVASSTKQTTSHDSGLETSLGRNHLPVKTYLIGRKLVDLRVINEANKEIYTADEGARIRLDALLVDNTGFYKVISVEHCYYSNRSINLSSKNSDELTMFIYKGCSVKNPRLLTQFTNSHFPSDHIQSSLFAAFRLGYLASLFFKCTFRLCSDIADCQQPPCDQPEPKEHKLSDQTFHETSYLTTSYQEFWLSQLSSISEHLLDVNGSIPARQGFMERWAHIEVQKNPISSSSINSPTVPASEFADLGFATLTSPLTNSKLLRCHHAICLNTAHIIWISTILLSLLILVCLIFLAVYRRFRFLNEKIKLQMLHQSTLSSTSTCCHEILSKVDWSTLSCNTYHQNPESLDKNSPSLCIVPIADQYTVDTVNRSPMVQPVLASEQSDISYLQTNRLMKCLHAPIKTVWNCGGSLQDDNGYNTTNITVNRKTIPNSGNLCYCDQLKPALNPRHAECHSVIPLQFTDHNRNGSIEQPEASQTLEINYGARLHSVFTKNSEAAEYHSAGLHFCAQSPNDVRMEDTIAVIPETYFTRGSGSMFLGSDTPKPKSVILNCSQSDDLILLNNCGAATHDSFATVKATHR